MADMINAALSATQSGDDWDLTVRYDVTLTDEEVDGNFTFDTNWTLFEHDPDSGDDRIFDTTVEKFKPEGTNPVPQKKTAC
jgi:hypothetical protein